GSPAPLGGGSYSATTYSVCLQGGDGNVAAGLNSANSAGVRAIGILNLMLLPTASDHYQFAGLNGVSFSNVTQKRCGVVANSFDPTNAVSGAYDLFFTGALISRAKSINGQPFRGDGTAYSDFISVFEGAVRDPETIVSVPG